MAQNDSNDDRQPHSTPDNTRRQFVAGTAGALGGLAAGTGFVAPALAQDEEGGETEQSDGEEEEEPIENEFEDDVAILNYARTLEFLEATFYQQGLENLDEEDFCNCELLAEDSALAERVYEELETIRAHEEAHVEVLGETIESLDGEPVESPEFDFGVRVEYVDVFLATAAQLEDTGVSAYAGAAPFIENADLVPPALGIHSVEARHASFIRTITGQSGFPNVIDEPRSRSEVLELISDFIVDSPDGMDDETADDEETDDELGDETDGAGNETDDDFGTGDDGNVTSPDDDGNVTSPDDDGNVTSPDDPIGNETDGTGNETG